jgi:hypothetical protein
MATFTLVDATVIINGVNLSNHSNKVTVTDNRDQIENTAFGALSKSYAKGLGDGTIDCDFFQDFAGGSVHATLQPLIGSTTPVSVEVRATSAGRSATNPAALLTSALLFSYNMLDGSLNEMSKISCTFQNASSSTGMTYPTS